jgi:hypothetical protein
MVGKFKQFEKSVKVGDRVKYQDKFYEVKRVHETRNWIELNGLEGSFQRCEIKVSRPKGV